MLLLFYDGRQNKSVFKKAPDFVDGKTSKSSLQVSQILDNLKEIYLFYFELKSYGGSAVESLERNIRLPNNRRNTLHRIMYTLKGRKYIEVYTDYKTFQVLFMAAGGRQKGQHPWRRVGWIGHGFIIFLSPRCHHFSPRD